MYVTYVQFEMSMLELLYKENKGSHGIISKLLNFYCWGKFQKGRVHLLLKTSTVKFLTANHDAVWDVCGIGLFEYEHVRTFCMGK